MAVNTFPTVPKKSSSPLLLIIGAVILVGGGLYWYFQMRGSASTPPPADGSPVENTPAPTTSQIDPKIEAQVAEILHAIDTVHKLNLDTKFFEDKRFTALHETTVVIPDIAPVNKHPFEFVGETVPTPPQKK